MEFSDYIAAAYRSKQTVKVKTISGDEIMGTITFQNMFGLELCTKDVKRVIVASNHIESISFLDNVEYLESEADREVKLKLAAFPHTSQISDNKV